MLYGTEYTEGVHFTEIINVHSRRHRLAQLDKLAFDWKCHQISFFTG